MGCTKPGGGRRPCGCGWGEGPRSGCTQSLGELRVRVRVRVRVRAWGNSGLGILSGFQGSATPAIWTKPNQRSLFPKAFQYGFMFGFGCGFEFVFGFGLAPTGDHRGEGTCVKTGLADVGFALIPCDALETHRPRCKRCNHRVVKRTPWRLTAAIAIGDTVFRLPRLDRGAPPVGGDQANRDLAVRFRVGCAGACVTRNYLNRGNQRGCVPPPCPPSRRRGLCQRASTRQRRYSTRHRRATWRSPPSTPHGTSGLDRTPPLGPQEEKA